MLDSVDDLSDANPSEPAANDDGHARGPRASLSRRGVLLALAGVAPAVYAFSPSSAATADDASVFLRTSRIVTGNEALSDDIARRIEGLLSARIDGFGAKLFDLSSAMTRTGGGRDAMLAALNETQVATALAIAKPRYLGYVGDPSSFVLKDDAVFATFIETQSFEKIIDVVPRPTYTGENAGWWAAPPRGVAPPPMPAAVTQWTFHPGGPETIREPSQAWLTYAGTSFASIDDARRAKPT